jgi:cytochrome c oxidase assembly protein subunit 15
VQVFLGAIVAGLHAGLSFNTWPLIDGAFVPSQASLLILQPAWRNLFENPLTAQFAHRMVAYAVLALALLHALLLTRARSPAAARAWLLVGIVSLQALLGILVLIKVVPLPLALGHQFGALLVVAAATVHLQAFWPAPRRTAADPAPIPARLATPAGGL